MNPEFEAGRFPAFGASYPLTYSTDREGMPLEAATVRFAWNESGLHVLAEMEDSRLIALNREDEQLHYLSGDVFELFVKPLNDTYYWEMYSIPSGNKSTLFFPCDRAGMELKDFLHGHNYRGLEVAVEKIPTGWNARMFIPALQLTDLGADWNAGAEWTILCGRYNYNNEDLSSP